MVGYFTQDASDLDPEMSPLDVLVWQYDMLPADARNLLGRFLLSGDDVYRPIKTLSGGETNKLSLAKLTHLNPNLLVLDEPTNHLDMASRDALAIVLKEYKGTLILVSHDRWLLSQVTDHTLDIKRTGPVEYPGSYTEYRLRVASGKPMPVATSAVSAPVVESPTMSPRELSKEIQRLEKVVGEIEKDVASIEQEIHELEQKLANVSPTDDVWELSKQHAQLKEELEGNVSAWAENSEKLEQIRAQQGK